MDGLFRIRSLKKVKASSGGVGRGKVTFINQAAELFGEKLSQTKAEAFLKGYLMGLGFEEIVKEPGLAIEDDILEIKARVVERQVEQAKEALRGTYTATGRAIPEWMKE